MVLASRHDGALRYEIKNAQFLRFEQCATTALDTDTALREGSVAFAFSEIKSRNRNTAAVSGCEMVEIPKKFKRKRLKLSLASAMSCTEFECALRIAQNIQLQPAASDELSRVIWAKLFAFTATANEILDGALRRQTLKLVIFWFRRNGASDGCGAFLLFLI